MTKKPFEHDIDKVTYKDLIDHGLLGKKLLFDSWITAVKVGGVINWLVALISGVVVVGLGPFSMILKFAGKFVSGYKVLYRIGGLYGFYLIIRDIM